jgi:hypothetical protein
MEGLLESAAEENSPLELEERVELGTQFLDSTCVKLNIHYPTDWVLAEGAAGREPASAKDNAAPDEAAAGSGQSTPGQGSGRRPGLR